MSLVLVDTSIWIDYFRGNSVASALHRLIESNHIVTNDLILAELLPSIIIRKEDQLQELILAVRKVELRIDWQEVRRMQIRNLESGNNHVGIPDIIIAQNAIQNDLILFENDKHFSKMKSLFGLELLRIQET
jgi:hypothetical protein